MIGIYEIYNKKTEEFYIGSSIDIKRRLCQHRSNLRGNRHANPFLQNSFNAHGEENFLFFKLMETSEESLLDFEQLFLDHSKPAYNIAEVAASPALGLTHNRGNNLEGRFGSTNNASKLTDEQVKDIRASVRFETDTEIAKRYSVTRKTIANIRTGHTWPENY